MAEVNPNPGDAAIVPPDFGTAEWMAEKRSLVRIWRGIDGLTKTARFPDGTTFTRDLDLWPKSNGYNPAIFTIDGEVRMTTRKDLEHLRRLNPFVRPETVIYRKDFVTFMDYEFGILRDSDGKIINVRPNAERGQYDQIINAGLTGLALNEARIKDIKDATELADSIANSDRRNSELQGYRNGHRIGYHGAIERVNEFQEEINRAKVLDTKRLYVENKDTVYAMEMLEEEAPTDTVLDILSRNFNEEKLAEPYISKRLFDHYDSLGYFYTKQLRREEISSADISSQAAKDALKGAFCREELVAIGVLEMEKLRAMSTDEVVEEFNFCLERGFIEEIKGGNLDMAMYKASQKQCSYISQSWDTLYIPESFLEKYTRKDLALDAMRADDSLRKLEYRDAKELFAFNALKVHLKPYVTEKKFAEIVTARAALTECKKYYASIDINANPAVFTGGKVNRLQAKELKSHGENPKDYATYEEAKAKIDTFEPTAEQIKDASRFMKQEEIEKLNRGEIAKAIAENKKAYAEHMHASVCPEIRAIVERALDLSKDKHYTYADWAKDSVAIPPTREQLAFIHKNGLEKTVDWYAKIQAEKGNKKFVDSRGETVHSIALYDAVKAFHERRVIEKQNSPMDEYQKKFFRDHGWEINPETTWKAANDAMLTTTYMEGLIGKANYKFLQSHDDVLDKQLQDKLFAYEMTNAEREVIRKEVNDCCNEARKRERMAKIEGVSITDNSVYGSPRNFANEYMSSHKGSMKGIEEAMVRGYVNGDITFPDEHTVISNGGIASLAVGHVMASILPYCVGEYNDAVERFSDMYEAELKAKEKVNGGEGQEM